MTGRLRKQYVVQRAKLHGAAVGAYIKGFKFTFLGVAGAVDSRLKQAMIESEVLQEAAILNSALPPRDQRDSTQPCFMLVLRLAGSAQRLLEHAGDGEGLLSWRRLVAE